MGSKITPASGQHAGFILPWPFSSTLAEDHDLGTDYTEADPEFGAASYSGNGRATLLASGTPQTGITSVAARFITGGMPDGESCSIVAQKNGTGDWYGRDLLTHFTGYRRITDAEGRGQDIAALDDGTLVMVYGLDNGSTITYSSRTRDPDTGAWAAKVDIVTTTQTALLAGPVCGVCVVPDGALHAYVVATNDGGTTFTIDCYRSEDEGVSWLLQRREVDTGRVGGRWATGDTILPVRLRVASGAGTVLIMLTEESANVYTKQFFSSDGGFTFKYVNQTGGTGAAERRTNDLRWVAGAYLAIVSLSSGAEVRAFVSGTPQSDILAADGFTVTASGSTEAGSCVVWDGVGYPIVFLEEFAVPRWSTDWGETWIGSTTAYGIRMSSTVGVCNAAAAVCRGQVIMVCNRWDGAAPDDGIYEVRFGGVSAVTFGAEINGWSYAYTPLNTLNAAGWTDSDTGAPTRTRSDRYGVNVVCGAGDTANNNRDITLTTAGVSGYFQAIARVNSSTNLTAPIRFGFRVPDAGIYVELSTTQIRAYDETGAAPSWTSTGFAAGSYVQIVAVIDAGNTRARVWYRELSIEAPGYERGWTALSAITGIADPGNDVRSRVRVGSDTDADILSLAVQYRVGESLLSNGIAWSEHSGIPLSAQTPSWAVGGASVSAINGPAVRDGTSYSIPASSPYTKRNLLPDYAPSPRVVWRSTATAAQDLRFTVDPDQEAAALVGSDAVGIYLTGLVGCGSFDLYNAGSSVASVDLRTAFAGSRLSSTSPTVRPTVTGGAVAGPWVAEGELVGGAIEFGSGDVRRITANTSGSLRSGPEIEHRCVITVEGIDGTESTSGTMYVHPPRALVIWYLRGSTNVNQIRLVFDSGDALGPDGYREIGTICAGPIRVLGRGWDRQTAHVTDSGRELVDHPDRSRSYVERGPMRRRAEVAIVGSAWDVTQIRRTSTADYVVVSDHASAVPSGTRYGDPLGIEGLFREWQAKPLVFLPSVPIETGSGAAVVAYTIGGWARDAIYGRIVSESIRREHAGVGAPGVSEMYRIATLAVEEEP